MDVDAIGENFLISLLQQLIISCDETITNLRSCDASQPLFHDSSLQRNAKQIDNLPLSKTKILILLLLPQHQNVQM